MNILTVDIGTGTQDIFLYDSRLDIENGFKMIVPSPTMMVHQQILTATQRREDILLQGLTMGGGPSNWAAEKHMEAGLQVFATPDAAKSFNDDLDVVSQIGIQIISEDEAARLPETVQRIDFKDFDFKRIQSSFQQYGVTLDNLSAVAIGVFDHGNAPNHISDRQFRFDYINNRIQETNRLSGFAFHKNDVPTIMTRMQAVAMSTDHIQAPVVLMDTAPAAILGATYDSLLNTKRKNLIVNIGNLHTLAFRLGTGGIEGVFEHHTGLLDREKLEKYIMEFASGTLSHEEIFNDHGHGALLYTKEPMKLVDQHSCLAVTGPRRKMLANSLLNPYFPAPLGDMMISGCIGLLAAVADLLPAMKEVIETSLNPSSDGNTAPWDINP